MSFRPESIALSPKVGRLPVNPRRRRVPADQRKRALRACNACNIRRTKCSGEDPCSRCLSNSRACEYPPEKDKAAGSEEAFSELQERCMLLQRCLVDAVPSENNREALLAKWSKTAPNWELSTADTGPPSRDEEAETGDGRVLQDPDGYVRYLGESSGAAFMDRLREFVGTVFPLLSTSGDFSFPNGEEVFTYLLGRYHTHDSRPLLLPDLDAFYLPEAEEISKYVAVFRFYAGDGNGSSHCGGIYYWGDLQDLEEQLKKPNGIVDIKEDPHLLCNLNAIMALACQYEPSLALSWESYPGETFFGRAKLLLINPMEDTSVAYMRALCLMSQYLLGLYRRDAAFMYVGLAVRISVIHGLHKKSVGEQSNREFWNTIILDRWLSCLLGRPTTIPREAITVDLPMDMVGTSFPSAAGIRAHAQLALIMDEIVNSIYGTASTGLMYPHTLSRADAALQKLSSWLAQLPSCLKVSESEEMNERASIWVHLIYNQLIILCTRPSLFQAAKQSVAIKYMPTHQHRQRSPNTEHIKKCAQAARDITKLTRQLLFINQATLLANVDYHFPFNAGIVLGLVSLLNEHASSDDQASIDFLAEYLQKAAEEGNESAGDCARMVREFEGVVARLRLQTTVPLASTLTFLDPSFGDGSLVDAASKTLLQPMPQNKGTDDITFQSDVETFAEGQSGTYEELLSWFIQSPV